MCKYKYGKYICAGLLIMTSLFLYGCDGNAKKVYENAVNLFETGKFVEAGEEFKKAIEKNPDRAEYYIGYGMSLLATSQYEEAREQFISVIRDTDNRIVRENNKKAYRGIALTYYENGEYDQARAYFMIAAENKELSEMNTDIEAYIANCEMYLGNYDSSLEYWNKVIDNSKGVSSATLSQYYIGRARIKVILDDLENAIKDYNKAIEEDKYCYQAHIGLYLTLLECHDESSASTVLESVLGLKDRNEEDAYYKSVMYFYSGDYDKAKEGLETALDKEIYEAYFYLGQINQVNQDYQGAVDYYNSYLEKCPGSEGAELCNQMAGCMIELEQYEAASEWITKGIGMAAGSVKKQLLYNEVIICERLGDFETAKIKAKEYLEIYNDDENMKNEYEFIRTRSRN